MEVFHYFYIYVGYVSIMVNQSILFCLNKFISLRLTGWLAGFFFTKDLPQCWQHVPGSLKFFFYYENVACMFSCFFSIYFLLIIMFTEILGWLSLMKNNDRHMLFCHPFRWRDLESFQMTYRVFDLDDNWKKPFKI